MFFSHKYLKKILNHKNSLASISAYALLILGSFLCSIFLFFLAEIKSSNLIDIKDEGFYVISKKNTIINSFTNSFIFFEKDQISEIKKLNGVKKIGKIFSSVSPSKVNIKGNINFTSEIFLEAMENTFLDIDTSSFAWSRDSSIVPILMSKEFLNIYNFSFSLSNSMPMLTEASASLIPLELGIYKSGYTKTFKSKIYSFTNRYLSILVPINYMEWINNSESSTLKKPTKLVVHISSENHGSFFDYLDEENLILHNNKAIFSKNIKTIQLLIYLFLLLGISILIISILLIYLSNKLEVANSKSIFTELQIIGASKNKLRNYFLFRALKRVIISSFISTIISFLLINYLKNEFFYIPFANFYEIKLFLLFIIITVLIFLLSWLTMKNLKFGNIL